MNFCLILCLFNVGEKEMESFKIIRTSKKSYHILNKLLLLCSIVIFMLVFHHVIFNGNICRKTLGQSVAFSFLQKKKRKNF